MSTPVIWLAKDGECTKCRWDEWIIQDILEAKQKRPATLPSFRHFESNGSDVLDTLGPVVVILAGGGHVDDAEWVNEQLAGYDEVVLIITSDEGAEFPVEALDHPNLKLWVQTPNPDKQYPIGTQYLPIGSGRAWRHAALKVKEHRAFLSCQQNHSRRMDALANTARVPNSAANGTAGFLKGYSREVYLEEMARSWWCPAPSGVVSNESFRMWEAIELGSIPIPDALRADGGGDGYWSRMAPGFPVAPITEWRRLPSLLDSSEQFLTAAEIELMTHGWWHLRRREMARTLASQVGQAAGPLTVIVPTSPIASHPDSSIIDATIRSIRERTDAEILITCDQPRPEMQHYAEAYTQYERDLMIRAEKEWWNVTPIVMHKFCHQVEMLRQTLEVVDSEFILYVEHDTPLIGDIDFDDVISRMREHNLNLMRFYHESAVHPEHEHLMVGPASDGWRATMQWSQRPHVARRSFYEKQVLRMFDSTARCMIEDPMFGIVEGAWLEKKQAGWDQWRLALWHPEGNIQRSTHLDGRGADPKFEDKFKFRYRSGRRPPGAPKSD